MKNGTEKVSETIGIESFRRFGVIGFHSFHLPRHKNGNLSQKKFFCRSGKIFQKVKIKRKYVSYD